MSQRLAQLSRHISTTAARMSKTPDITLYTAQTPNGVKLSIILEELGLPYQVKKISFDKSEQKEPWFLEINPNGRIPAMTDKFHDGKTIRLFESGSCMHYLIEQYDKDNKISYPQGSREAYETNNWLFFQNAGLGPMQGQSNHFFRYAPEKIQYGIDRYRNETKRLYGVLDKHLASATSGFIVGDKCTIADITTWGWVSAAAWAGIDLSEFKYLSAWEQKMAERPAFKKGMDIPEKNKLREILKDPKKTEEYAKGASGWVMKGQKEDAEKAHGSK